MTPDEIQKEAEKQLLQWPAVPWNPEWHPYYWMGRRDAAKEIHESKDKAGNR